MGACFIVKPTINGNKTQLSTLFSNATNTFLGIAAGANIDGKFVDELAAGSYHRGVSRAVLAPGHCRFFRAFGGRRYVFAQKTAGIGTKQGKFIGQTTAIPGAAGGLLGHAGRRRIRQHRILFYFQANGVRIHCRGDTGDVHPPVSIQNQAVQRAGTQQRRTGSAR